MTNYFKLLDIQARYDIDLRELEQKYFDAQKRTHPDKVFDETKKVAALNESMQINAAYKTLKFPASRAEYILNMHGITLKDNINDPSYNAMLMEGMEDREDLENANNENSLKKMLQRVQLQIDTASTELKLLFHENMLSDIPQTLTRMKYKKKLLDEIQNKLLGC